MDDVLHGDELRTAFDSIGPWATRFHVAGQDLGGPFEVREDEPLIRDFLERLQCPQRVLELGCLEGGRTIPLARRAAQVVGVDIRREHLRRARFISHQMGVHNTLFLELDLESRDLQTLGTFDVVYNVGLLYHLSDPARLLNQLAKISPRMFLYTHVADEQDADLVQHGGYTGRFVEENIDDLVAGTHLRSFRPTRASLLRMLDDAGYHSVEVIRDDTIAYESGRIEQKMTLWCRTSSMVAMTASTRRALPNVDVIITSHNYGRFLDECLQSVMAQTRRPNDILVVDDASDDETQEVAARWADWGVRVLRVDCRDPRLARLAGVNATTSEFICMLDADDWLSPDYLRAGLAEFDRYDVGLVYSSVDFFGDWNYHRREPQDMDGKRMSELNYIHNGSLVRREALEMSRALEQAVDADRSHEDWVAWRIILEQGWKARRQAGVYCYRRHGSNRTIGKYKWNTYYNQRALAVETITLFVALSGRHSLWPRFREFLEKQTWPHQQVRLFLLDTSQDAAFGAKVRQWIASSDYQDVRYSVDVVGPPGLADLPREGKSIDLVRMAAARIYNRMAREVIGDFIWIVEDDVIPPVDAAKKLLESFDEWTASVAAPYRSRIHEGYVAWGEHTAPVRQHVIREPGEGTQRIAGNGFGCVMLRSYVLKDVVFTCRQSPHFDFDPAFYERLQGPGKQVKMNWDCRCDHVSVTQEPAE